MIQNQKREEAIKETQPQLQMIRYVLIQVATTRRICSDESNTSVPIKLLNWSFRLH